MVGDIFAENFAAALIVSGHVLKRSMASLETLLAKASISAVPGRLQLVTPVNLPWRPLVYVDYAHTPDAIERAILTLSSEPDSVTTVFGCGGDRDKSKRAIMGQIASRLSRDVFVTSDNPRTESPEAIVDEVISGVLHGKTCHKVLDRRSAIEQAISSGGATRKILIAGKGHEDYQIIGQTKLRFSDEEEALRSLQKPRVWLVFGAGLSGFEASKHLERYGDRVYLSDDKEISRPDGLGSSVVLIRKDEIPWGTVSGVIISPGVPLDHDIVSKAIERGLDVITEIDLGFDRYRGNILAVTGTNGKSTTVAMTEHIFMNLGLPAAACGNIGLPPTALNLRAESPAHTAIVELSSYQLEGSLPWHSRVAAITSFSFDHLARHKTLKQYFEAKWRITSWLTPSSLLIVADDVARYAGEFGVKWPDCRLSVVGFSDSCPWLPAGANYIKVSAGLCQVEGKTLDLGSSGVSGAHNQVNALMATIMAAEVTGHPVETLLSHLSSYRPLTYRCEVIYNSGGRFIVNDSKSTNLESTMSALTMARRPAILLMGGQGKGESYSALAEKRKLLRLLVTFGASREAIKADAPDGLAVSSFEKMRDAVLHGLRVARDNNCDLIFSPGCASFDEFKNFEHRGTVFNELVQAFNSGSS
jgi:UDP-N-acetylmuramoylalanine--D-glutamate ligase